MLNNRCISSFSQNELIHPYVVKMENILSQWLALEFLLEMALFV